MGFGIRTRLLRWRRAFAERAGIGWYSKTGLYGMDDKLAPFLHKKRGGFFIECGANDGFDQSNTYYLERILGWRGILVEGIPALARSCAARRPNSTVLNCALVAQRQEGRLIEMRFGNLMSVVHGGVGSPEVEADHVQRGLAENPELKSYSVMIPGRTISSILDEYQVKHVDFFSLDVEGFEAEVLRGMDFSQHRPTYLLVEIRSPNAVRELLNPYYEEITTLSTTSSHSDVLFRVRP